MKKLSRRQHIAKTNSSGVFFFQRNPAYHWGMLTKHLKRKKMQASSTFLHKNHKLLNSAKLFRKFGFDSENTE